MYSVRLWMAAAALTKNNCDENDDLAANKNVNETRRNASAWGVAHLVIGDVSFFKPGS